MTRGKTATRADLVATFARKTGVPPLIVKCVLDRVHASRITRLKGDVRLRVELAARAEGWSPSGGYPKDGAEAARLRLLFPSPKGVGF